MVGIFERIHKLIKIDGTSTTPMLTVLGSGASAQFDSTQNIAIGTGTSGALMINVDGVTLYLQTWNAVA